jgi:hypothetical protein
MFTLSEFRLSPDFSGMHLFLRSSSPLPHDLLNLSHDLIKCEIVTKSLEDKFSADRLFFSLLRASHAVQIFEYAPTSILETC